MPLEGYLKKTDPGRISTLSTVRDDPTRRKRIKVGTNQAQLSIYVRDCDSHEPMGVVIPVNLRIFIEGVGWEDIGVGKCCPLCWLILVPPEDVDLPAPNPLSETKASKSLDGGSGKGGKSTARATKSHRPKASRGKAAQSVEDFAESGDEFTIRDIMETTGLSRTAVRKEIMALVKLGKLEIRTQGGGKGNRSVFISP